MKTLCKRSAWLETKINAPAADAAMYITDKRKDSTSKKRE